MAIKNNDTNSQLGITTRHQPALVTVSSNICYQMYVQTKHSLIAIIDS